MTDTSAQTRRPGRAERDEREVKRGWFARLRLFLAQILDELRKVVRPTRNELWQYTLVVIVFVTVMMTLVAGLDLGFSKLIGLVFGG